MGKPATTKRNRILVYMPDDLYQEFKSRADERMQSESSFGASLIKHGLQATTTEACVNSTQAHV